MSCVVFRGSNGARTHDLSRVRRTLIPAELCFRDGPEGIRTLDLCVANAALSQLSYGPGFHLFSFWHLCMGPFKFIPFLHLSQYIYDHFLHENVFGALHDVCGNRVP